ncbi:MAG: hypothetical protein ACYCZP_05585 [Acidimicrobiales bacterium]
MTYSVALDARIGGVLGQVQLTDPRRLILAVNTSPAGQGHGGLPG